MPKPEDTKRTTDYGPDVWRVDRWANAQPDTMQISPAIRKAVWEAVIRWEEKQGLSTEKGKE